MSAPASICIAVLAHNEERRIARCLNSLPLSDANVIIHVLVNGSIDRTAQIARGIAAEATNVTIHEWHEGGKARSWNRFVFDTLAQTHDFHIFTDGDAEVRAGSIAALVETMCTQPYANAAAALPMNGRSVAAYKSAMRRYHGLWGDLYALRGSFIERMRKASIRLPDDLVGDDGLICAMAKTDLGNEDHWDDRRVAQCESAGFLCEPVSLLRPESWRMQYKRMVSYSIRYYQNGLISKIMRGPGPSGLPQHLATLYPIGLADAQPRNTLPLRWFDSRALARMRA